MIVAPVEFERIVQCGCGERAQAELIVSRTRRRHGYRPYLSGLV
jgi:hypothetical protein